MFQGKKRNTKVKVSRLREDLLWGKITLGSCLKLLSEKQNQSLSSETRCSAGLEPMISEENLLIQALAEQTLLQEGCFMIVSNTLEVPRRSSLPKVLTRFNPSFGKEPNEK